MVLLVENVAKKIGEKNILEGISFSMNEGDFVCLTGPSGCGKTTLLRLLAGLVAPSSGRICLNGRPAGAEGNSGYVFQEGALFPWLTVAQNVAFGLNLRKVPRPDQKEWVREALRMVEMEGFAGYYPRELSGGMRMRVALARVLVYQPKIIFMDEPFAALDFRTRHKLQQDLVAMWQQLKPSILMVTHNIDEAVYLSNRIIVLSGRPGKILEQVEVGIDRPRERTDSEFGQIRKRVLSLLGE